MGTDGPPPPHLVPARQMYCRSSDEVTEITTSPALSTMEVRYRKDLVKTWPVNFTFSGLTSHFTSEFEYAVGYSPPRPVIKNIVQKFMALWKTSMRKDKFLTGQKCQSWLETPLPVNHISISHVTPLEKPVARGGAVSDVR